MKLIRKREKCDVVKCPNKALKNCEVYLFGMRFAGYCRKHFTKEKQGGVKQFILGFHPYEDKRHYDKTKVITNG